jgi:membrane-associated phospholipid phosphatase
MSGHAFSAEHIADASARRRAAVRERGPLLLAVGFLVAMAVVWSLAELVPAVRARDASALYHLTLLDRPSIESIGHHLLHLLEPVPYTLWAFMLVGIAVALGRVREAVVAAALLALGPGTAETLKPLLAHAHDAYGSVHVGPASWPSGHATAALTLACAASLIAPDRLKPLVAGVGAAFAAGIGLLLLILAWHMPSDVIGGYLVAGFWTALAVAALRWSARRRLTRERPEPTGAPRPEQPRLGWRHG